MQKNNFLLLQNLKNTKSAQLWEGCAHYGSTEPKSRTAITLSFTFLATVETFLAASF